MNTRYFWLSLLAVAASFAGGFLLANAINRGELDKLRSENERLLAGEKAAAGSTLTNEEIDRKIAEADRDADNAQFQKSLGLALYRYAAMKQDTALLEKAERILDRAVKLLPDDRDVLIGHGHANFDIGYANKDNARFQTARSSYLRALNIQPKDADITTDLGLTFFLQDPPDYARAEAELKKALEIAPGNEKALQFLIQTLVKANKPQEAGTYLERLRKVSPANPSIGELAATLEQANAGQTN